VWAVGARLARVVMPSSSAEVRAWSSSRRPSIDWRQQRAEVEAGHREEGARVHALAQRDGVAQPSFGLAAASESQLEQADPPPDRAVRPGHHAREGGQQLEQA
jgi:hypothetical protein